MCIRCMAIPTPHIISIIWASLSPMIILIDLSLSHLFVFLLHLLSVSPFRCQISCSLIRPKCITILYCNFTLCIDIFHFKVLFLCFFVLFYTVCNFPVPEQQSQDSAVKSGYQVAESDQVQMR